MERRSYNRGLLTVGLFAFCMTAVMALTALSSFAMDRKWAYAKVQLDEPTGLCWSDKYGDEYDEDYYYVDNDPLYVNWDEVEGASSYLVYLYRTTSGSSYTKVAEFTTKNTRVNVTSKTKKDGVYYFYVMAKGKGDYADSDWSDISDGMMVTSASIPAYYYYDYYEPTIQSGPSNEGYTANNSSPGVISGYGWQQTNGRWWYSTSPVGTDWYRNGWHWIDGKCYYFGPDGYMYANTTTPDGYTVNASGQWTVNGVVQTK